MLLFYRARKRFGYLFSVASRTTRGSLAGIFARLTGPVGPAEVLRKHCIYARACLWQQRMSANRASFDAAIQRPVRR
jgi:hypothetical protein